MDGLKLHAPVGIKLTSTMLDERNQEERMNNVVIVHLIMKVDS